MMTLHRWLVYTELILIVIPATIFLGFALLLLVPYSFEMGTYSVRFWLLWAGGVVGGYSLWLTFANLWNTSVETKTKVLISSSGIFGLVANMFPFVYISLQSQEAKVFPYVVFYLPCLVWFHWATLIFTRGFGNAIQSSPRVVPPKEQ